MSLTVSSTPPISHLLSPPLPPFPPPLSLIFFFPSPTSHLPVLIQAFSLWQVKEPPVALNKSLSSLATQAREVVYCWHQPKSPRENSGLACMSWIKTNFCGQRFGQPDQLGLGHMARVESVRGQVQPHIVTGNVYSLEKKDSIPRRGGKDTKET